ncbi:MAG: YfiR family protein [Planctomycetes bacterium]|nr:YfiR family protein [Planctomycetota bacterium]MCC7398461.1 YfiR family protein [Planctomycetota bacterium]
MSSPPRHPIAAVTTLVTLLASALGWQDPEPQEREVTRAAMLRATVILKLAPYVSPDVPPEARPPRPNYRIAVVGNDDLATAIVAQLPGKKVDKAPVQVAELSERAAAAPPTPPEYELLYIAASVDDKTLARIIAAHRQLPVLLICERPGFVRAGGGVQLFVQDNGVRFEVNQQALKDQGQRASPELLKLSRRGPS